MLLLLGSRNIYYLYKRFKDWHLSEEAIDNNDLILIYVEEILFNFIIFYNIANQSGSQLTPQAATPTGDSLMNASITRNQTSGTILYEDLTIGDGDKSSILIIETESDEDDSVVQRIDSNPLLSPKDLR